MESKALSRLILFAAALLLAGGCAGAPIAARPAAQPTTAVDHAYPAAKPADPSHAYPAAQPADPGHAYPAPDSATLAQAAYPQPAVAPAVPGQQGETAALRYRVVNSYPHDPQAYTQGLVYVGDDTFYEGTGLFEGQSTLREVELTTGNVRTKVNLAANIFGEGVAVVGERIFQLTWQNGVGFIYDYQDGAFVRTGQFSYPPAGRDLPVEGWGLATDGQRLIMSDGTASLYFVDPEATASTGLLAITGQVEVRDESGPVINLNELEYIDGALYANIWQRDVIARIDPASGRVTGYLDLSGLRALLPPSTDPNLPPPEVLNGIAYDAENERLFVTGKRWPRLFEIDIVSGVSWIVYLPVAEAA
jgi:glutamine cyclotransferase